MHTDRLEEARRFLEELAESPPWLPFESALLPLLFAATREGSTSSIDDIMALIERSQKLTSKVLSIANSAVYALESKVSSLHWAIRILGFREVRTLVIIVGAVSAIKSVRLPKGFASVELWRHQVKTAAIARELCAALKEEARAARISRECALAMEPDEAYVAGLLHDIGKVFLAAIRPKIWAAMEKIRAENSLSFVEAEDAYWCMDHALIGAQVLHYWKLPLLLTDPINWHHAPDLAPAFQAEAALLAAANLLAHQPELPEQGLPDQVVALLPQGADVTRVSEALRAALSGKKTDAVLGLLDY